MKKILLTSAFLITALFQTAASSSPRSEQIKAAVDNFSACGNFMRFDEENVYTSQGMNQSGVRFTPLSKAGEFQIETLAPPLDVVKVGSSTFILTTKGLEEWNLLKFERLAAYKTNILSRPYEKDENAKAVAVYKNKLVLAHGRLGISFFDVASKQVTRTIPAIVSQRPLESSVTGVTVSGQYAFAVVDNYSVVGQNEKPAFRGIIVIDLETEKVISELDGMDPGADSISTDGKVALVSFYGQPIWKYSISSLLKSSTKVPEPLRRVFQFPEIGHPVGHASLDDKYYYTCFSRVPKPGEGSLFIREPRTLDRRVLMLD